VQCYRGAIIRLKAAWRHHLDCSAKATCRPAVECKFQTRTSSNSTGAVTRCPWLQTTTDAREQNNTGPSTLCV